MIGYISPQGQAQLPTLVLTPEQCLGARAMLRMRREDLAGVAQVAQATLTDFEAGKRRPYPRTLAAIRAALEAAGVEFTNGDAPGVRLRPSKP
jgi:transcriptional regulator with XRE-family HTH domain